MKILLVAGARPNFMKIAPLMRAFEIYPDITPLLVHTGQHYDQNMSTSFFTSLGIPVPNYHLEVGSESHAVQTAAIMVKFEEVCLKEKPDVVVVVGDVNSTVAAALVAKKLHITVAHVEAGLRSRDRDMPEEINRLATDAISDLFFTTEEEGTANLLAEGVPQEKVHFVGHVMIDNLLYQLKKLDSIAPMLSTFELKARLPEKYVCLTMHRPSNVDNKETLTKLMGPILEIAATTPVIFPCHPRTRSRLEQFGFGEYLDKSSDEYTSGLHLLEPLGYDEFLYLWKDCTLMLTDSGGLQEETTALRVPCITMRQTTERPITASVGSNEVLGTDPDKILLYARNALSGNWKKSAIPPLWDGRAGERIAEILWERHKG